MSNLTSIGGSIIISNNNKLSSLDGLDKIEDGTITNLVISDNELLSTCDVTSVCNYLSDMTSVVDIRNNSIGCNSSAEVVTACTYGISGQSFSSEFIIIPNPAINKISVLSVNGLKIKEIKIYNQWGQLILKSIEEKEVIDISNFEPGLYIVEIISDKLKHRGKLVIHK